MMPGPNPSLYAQELDAECGSRALLNHLRRAGQALNDPPRRKLTFAEQLALVESGQSTILAWSPPRKPDPERTLGGVSW